MADPEPPSLPTKDGIEAQPESSSSSADATPSAAANNSDGRPSSPVEPPTDSVQLFRPDDEGTQMEDHDEREWVLAGRPESYYSQVLQNVRNRLLEGQGECMCKVGVDSRGRPKGITEEDYNASLETVHRVAADLKAAATLVVEKVVKEAPKLQCAELLVRRVGEDSYIDMRIAICGNVDSGKSTFVGVLTKGVLDNGRGSVRQKVFRHKHEMDTGMTGSMPDYACIVISANNGIQRMTKEHLGLCLALKIPFYVVITRIDMTPEPVTKNTTENVLKLLKHSGVNKLPYMVRKPEDVVICAKNIKDDRIAPIFHVSNVTGDNFDLMRRYLNLLPVRRDWYGMAKEPLEVIIDSTFYVPGVGTVVGGIVTSGVLQSNDTVWLGPNANGHFRQAVVKSIHVKQCLTNHVEAGTAACFAIKKERRSDIRKGMVLVDAKNKPAAVWEFEAEIVVLYHSTTIQSNYQPVVHCGTVRQSCAIILVDRDVLRTGDKARVKFRFMYKPEYVKKGLKLIFREGRTKGLGTITDTFGVRSS